MPQLFGRTLSRRDVDRHTAGPLALFGVELLTLADGAERGVRVVEFRSGTGLVFRIMVERALDLGTIEYRGAAIGWQSATRFRHPALHETTGEGGLSWLRSFSGFLATCGLDHAFGAAVDDSDPYEYPARKRIEYGLHGRVAYLPGTLDGYGARWEGDRCFLWCEGTVVQAAMFAENLALKRRWEVEVGTNRITLSDRVTNRGFRTTPHMMLYHVNLGWPLLDEGARFLAPIKAVRDVSHADRFRKQSTGYRTVPAPQPRFVEQVWDYDTVPDAEGRGVYALVNDGFDGGRGLGLAVEAAHATLPHLTQWQAYEEGVYAMGIEPGTDRFRGRDAALKAGTLTQLAGDESRDYALAFEVLDGREAIARTEARIRAVQVPPEDEFPAVG